MSEICKIGTIFERKPGNIISTYDDLLDCVNYRNWAALINIQVDDRKITIPVDEKNPLSGQITKKSEFSKTLKPFNLTSTLKYLFYGSRYRNEFSPVRY